LGSAAIEHRSQILIFMEKVRGSTCTETDVSIEKNDLGRTEARFRLRLSAPAWRLTEVENAAPGEELLDEKIRADHRALDAEVFASLEPRWAAGEIPNKKRALLDFRARRVNAGRPGVRNGQFADSLARLEAAVAIDVVKGTNGAHLITRPK